MSHVDRREVAIHRSRKGTHQKPFPEAESLAADFEERTRGVDALFPELVVLEEATAVAEWLESRALQPARKVGGRAVEAGRGRVTPLQGIGGEVLEIPRELGGLQADPLTYLRVVELLAEGAGSVGWNVANNGIGQLITLGLPDEGVREIYEHGADTVIAGTAVMGGGRAVPVDGGYRVTGRWPFGTGCHESSWMLGSFQILDGGEPRSTPDGSSTHWRGIFARSEIQVVEGSWDVSGLRATGSFHWTVEDVFLPERRTMVHAGIPLDNQWKRWPGVSYALLAQAWVGPHHSAVITGIATKIRRQRDQRLGNRKSTRIQGLAHHHTFQAHSAQPSQRTDIIQGGHPTAGDHRPIRLPTKLLIQRQVRTRQHAVPHDVSEHIPSTASGVESAQRLIHITTLPGCTPRR